MAQIQQSYDNLDDNQSDLLEQLPAQITLHIQNLNDSLVQLAKEINERLALLKEYIHVRKFQSYDDKLCKRNSDNQAQYSLNLAAAELFKQRIEQLHSNKAYQTLKKSLIQLMTYKPIHNQLLQLMTKNIYRELVTLENNYAHSTPEIRQKYLMPTRNILFTAQARITELRVTLEEAVLRTTIKKPQHKEEKQEPQHDREDNTYYQSLRA